MAFDTTNRGVLFRNENKKTDKHPDYSGSLNADGVDYFFDAWIKVAESGRKFMSVSIKPKEKQAQAPAPSRKPSHDAFKARQVAKQSSGFDDMDSDLPPF